VIYWENTTRKLLPNSWRDGFAYIDRYLKLNEEGKRRNVNAFFLKVIDLALGKFMKIIY